MSEKIKPEDLSNLLFVSNPLISKNGQKILFIVSKYDLNKNRFKSNIWIYDNNDYYPLTKGENDFCPTWSNNNYIYFLLSDQGRVHLYAASEKNGLKGVITPEESSIDEFSIWPPPRPEGRVSWGLKGYTPFTGATLLCSTIKDKGFFIDANTLPVAFFNMFKAPFKSEWSLCFNGQLTTPLGFLLTSTLW